MNRQWILVVVLTRLPVTLGKALRSRSIDVSDSTCTSTTPTPTPTPTPTHTSVQINSYHCHRAPLCQRSLEMAQLQALFRLRASERGKMVGKKTRLRTMTGMTWRDRFPTSVTN
ncbi:hypothetical protein HD806DRAFT_485716 [Xylariaceae sp. AK1471]|nr:hypothetical protein HD806DRAFT_485716 [Xylariaceae sp. AK1471]